MAANMITLLKNMIDTQSEGIIIEQHIKKCMEMFGNSPQNKRGLTTLIIRYYIQTNNMVKVIEYLYMDGLMKRDYMTILDYIMVNYKYMVDTITYIYSKIDMIDMKDVDIMIENNWIDLLKRFDGYPVMTSLDSNDDGHDCKVYDMDIKKMRDIYVERIEVKDDNIKLVECMKDVDIIIDGANISHLSGQFKPSEVAKVIDRLENMGYKVKVVFHPTRKITSPMLLPYIIYTPQLRNDDDYLLYGMLKYGKMVLTNDLFRDHVKNMDIYTKCYVDSKTIRCFKKDLIIPHYSKCIQVKDKNIYIPSIKGGFYKLIIA